MTLPSGRRRRARPGLGTLVDIALDEVDDGRAEAAFAAAFETVALIHRLMSAHDAASDVRRLSEAAHLRPMRVHAPTLAVLRLAKAMHAQTGGIFDIAVGALRARAGDLPPLARASCATPGSSSSSDIDIASDGAVFFARPLHLDLGGIAKGHAVDCAVAALRARGVASGLVNAGGDMRAFGPAAHPVQLRFAGGVRTVAALREGALASSCNASAAGDSPHIDPRAGLGVRSRWSVLVQAPSAAVADALTKVALVCPATADRACASFAAEWRAFDHDAVVG